jgi:NIPSNAP
MLRPVAFPEGEESMNRRDFVAAAGGASLLPNVGTAAEQTTASGGPGPAPQILELRRYRLRFGPMEARFAEYQKNVLVPALNRVGVKPVGAFSVLVGPDNPAVHLLLPHPSADSVLTLATRLGADPEYQKGASSFRSLPAGDPPYVRRESSLLQAFPAAPTVEVPAGPQAAASRVFELRTYESHNEAAGAKKIEMFEKAGEIAIFRRVGLQPVFFGRNVVGPNLPSLTYMLVFADMAAREKSWSAFRDDPEWVKLRATPGYSNAEILTNITTLFLRPADYSQI